MTQVVLDAETRRKLKDLQQPLELCDEAGHVMGLLYPLQKKSASGAMEPRISEEELRHREKEKGGFSTAQVLAHLEKLS
jgi:hypothetical protein